MKESFGSLYSRLYRENFEELELMRQKEKKRIIKVIAIILGIFVTVLNFPILLPFAFIGIFITIAYFIWKSIKGENKVKSAEKTYKEVFKEKVVGPIIENCFENAKYTPRTGLSPMEYRKAGYKESYDRYRSEDLIEATLKVNGEETTSLTVSEVHTERKHKDSEGRTSYVTVFWGLAGSLDLPKDIQKAIYIRSNGRVSNWNKNKVKMDMSEFEKIFDVESDDQILAMRILTADVMAEMIDLYKTYKYIFEIHILNNKIYMRLRSGAMFEPGIFKSSMEYKQLEKYYLVLKALISISSHIYDTVSKIEL